MRFPAASLAVLVAVLPTACGCSGKRYPTAPVSGRVTLDGIPLAGARVGFEPMRQGDQLDAGPGSYGETDADGRYRLTSLDGKEGAVVGGHRVWVRTFRAKEGPEGRIVMETPERVPARYNVHTELTFRVEPGGTDAADFSLTSR